MCRPAGELGWMLAQHHHDHERHGQDGACDPHEDTGRDARALIQSAPPSATGSTTTQA